MAAGFETLSGVSVSIELSNIRQPKSSVIINSLESVDQVYHLLLGYVGVLLLEPDSLHSRVRLDRWYNALRLLKAIGRALGLVKSICRGAQVSHFRLIVVDKAPLIYGFLISKESSHFSVMAVWFTHGDLPAVVAR